MKQILTALVAITILALATTAGAQTNDKFNLGAAGVSFDQTKPAAQKQTTAPLPNMFGNDKGACEAALVSGKFRYYEPRYLSGHDENPLKTGDEVIPLEKDMCISLKTTSGMQYVVQKEGDKFRAHKLANGTFVIFARDDCGNRTADTPMGDPPPPSPSLKPVETAAVPAKLDVTIHVDGTINHVVSGELTHKIVSDGPLTKTQNTAPKGKFWTSWKRPGPYILIGGGTLAGGLICQHFCGGTSTFGVVGVVATHNWIRY